MNRSKNGYGILSTVVGIVSIITLAVFVIFVTITILTLSKKTTDAISFVHEVVTQKASQQQN
jgi:hypothetical protein